MYTNTSYIAISGPSTIAFRYEHIHLYNLVSGGEQEELPVMQEVDGKNPNQNELDASERCFYGEIPH